MISYQQEPLSQILKDGADLMCSNWEEVCEFPGETFDLDLDTCAALEAAGAARGFTARDSGTLVAYAIYHIGRHLYCNALHAQPFTFYVAPEYRGTGAARRLVAIAEHQLHAEGVRFLFQTAPSRRDASALWQRLGYRFVESHFVKELA